MVTGVVRDEDAPCAHGKHVYHVNNCRFEIDRKYAPLKAVGRGAYGVVCSARSTARTTPVAIKKIGNAFENPTDARRTLREVRLLRVLKHENIIELVDIMSPPSQDGWTEVYLVYELMDTDLHAILRSPQPLSDQHFQYFLYQILRGLKYMHTAHVLHRDLKPSNLLLNANCDLKICDFGLARTLLRPEEAEASNNFMTEYVVTRWYRAPELLLSADSYDGAIDVWSVGCILAEMLGRRPLFPGRDYLDQLKMITRQLGSPGEDELAWIHNKKARAFMESLPPAEPRSWEDTFPGANADALDLLSRMLVFNPARRVTVEEALRHPYLAELHDEATEPAAPGPVDADFEDLERGADAGLRALFWEELRHYTPGLPAWGAKA